jgi:hypothetical protein
VNPVDMCSFSLLKRFIWIPSGANARQVGLPVANRNSASSVEPAVDDKKCRRILRGIGMGKVWIGVLVVRLPIGTANGTIHRAWLPTAAGLRISPFLVYAEIMAYIDRLMC